MTVQALVVAFAVFTAVYGAIIGHGPRRTGPGQRLMRAPMVVANREGVAASGATGIRRGWPGADWLSPGALLRGVRRWLTPAARAMDEDDLEESLFALSAALEAGAGLVPSLTIAASQCPRTVADEFRRVVEEFNAGVSLSECLKRARGRVPEPSFRTLCDTIDIQRASGGDLRVGLASLAEIIRERRDLRQDLKVKTAEARQSAVILALIPPVLAGLAWLVRPDLIRPLWIYPAGRIGLGLGIALWALGGWTVSRLTRTEDIDGGWR